jgi:enoyl-CoA hydratase
MGVIEAMKFRNRKRNSGGLKMAFERILFEKKDGIATITMNRPEALNTLDRVMFCEIGEALGDAEKDSEVRVVVLKAKGRAFCAGMDLDFAGQELDNLVTQWDMFRLGKTNLLGKIEDLTKPVIAAVNGFAVAGGFEILMAVDFVIAAEDALLGDQHMKVGLFGAGGSPYRLPVLIGLRKAKELVLTGKRITGKEAEAIGLVNKAVPSEDLDRAVAELAAELAEKSPVTMRVTKSYMNRVALADSDAKLDMAMLSAIAVNSSEDYKEALTAFKEKRKPSFKGR